MNNPTTPTILTAAVAVMARRYMSQGLVPLTLNLEEFTARLLGLCIEQQYRLDHGKPAVAIPLHLVAGAQCLGVQVDIDTGKITGLAAPEGPGV